MYKKTQLSLAAGPTLPRFVCTQSQHQHEHQGYIEDELAKLHAAGPTLPKCVCKQPNPASASATDPAFLAPAPAPALCCRSLGMQRS